MKRDAQRHNPGLFATELANADDEAIMNVSPLQDMGRKAKELAIRDYENKMAACFAEMYRVLTDDGVLTVMFTPNRLRLGIRSAAVSCVLVFIDSSWRSIRKAKLAFTRRRRTRQPARSCLYAANERSRPNRCGWDDLKGKSAVGGRD